MKKTLGILTALAIGFVGLSLYSLFGVAGNVEMILTIHQDEDDLTEIENAIERNWGDNALNAFKWSCTLKRFNKIKTGKYHLQSGMKMNEVINYLRSGDPSTIMIRTDGENCRTLKQFCQRLADSLNYSAQDYLIAFCTLVNSDSSTLSQRLAISHVFADTYDFKYSDTPENIAQRFKKEHDSFWNTERLNLAKQINLTPDQVYTLASVVKGETVHFEEAGKIAGLYLNRLKKGMKLQADPTVKFAKQIWKSERILDADLQVDSPYNTYRYTGLPPGPIFIVEKKYVDAVLHHQNHDFVFMCAKSDGSKFHDFTNSDVEHVRNAQAYHRYLNKIQ
jgi:UPF0755 protein